MQTTAQLRTAAAQEEKNCNWRAAAELYQRAAESYPINPQYSALAAADIEQLKRRARSCRTMVVVSEDLCGFRKVAA